jgi:multidrug efflux system membrane fusion protein
MPEETNVHKPKKTSQSGRSEGPSASQSSLESGASQQSSSPTHVPAKFPKGLIIGAVVITALIAAGIFFFGHKKDDTTGRGKPKDVPVTVATAQMETVPIQIRTTGNIAAYSTVNIIPQVGGQLQKVFFTQGQMVKKGDLLVLIDPRPYKASLDQALGNVEKDKANVKAAQANMARDLASVGQLQANLAKDQASLQYADVEAKRYKQLVQQGAISMEQADQTVTNDATAQAQIQADKKQIENEQAVVNSDKAQIDTAKATQEADEAVVENAKIQLGWCTIKAPIDGRTGSLQIYEGNVVTANSTTPIVTIAQVQPIYVQFTVPEEYLDQMRRCLMNGTLRIQALIEGVATDAVIGAASFMDNTVNTTSGTALLRASFDNADSRLYPGQFVDVMVTMPPPGPSVVVPISAIQTTQKGNAVYVVKPDKTVELVPVDMVRSSDDWAALDKGVHPGDIVVTDGQLQLTPGASVKVVSENGSKSKRKSGGSSPDAGFNPSSSVSDDSSSSGFNPVPAGNSAQSGTGSGWGTGKTPSWGQQSTPQSPNAPPLPTASAGNPSSNTAPSAGKDGGFHALGGANNRDSTNNSAAGWHHRH